MKSFLQRIKRLERETVELKDKMRPSITYHVVQADGSVSKVCTLWLDTTGPWPRYVEKPAEDAHKT